MREKMICFCGVLMTVATVLYRRENAAAETVIMIFCVMLLMLAGFRHGIVNAMMLLYYDCNHINDLVMVGGNTPGSLCYGYLYHRSRGSKNK